MFKTLVAAGEASASQNDDQPEHREGSDMTQAHTDNTNYKKEASIEGDEKRIEQKKQDPIVLVHQRKKRKLKTFPKFPKTKKAVLVVPNFVEEK